MELNNDAFVVFLCGRCAKVGWCKTIDTELTPVFSYLVDFLWRLVSAYILALLPHTFAYPFPIFIYIYHSHRSTLPGVVPAFERPTSARAPYLLCHYCFTCIATLNTTVLYLFPFLCFLFFWFLYNFFVLYFFTQIYFMTHCLLFSFFFVFREGMQVKGSIDVCLLFFFFFFFFFFAYRSCYSQNLSTLMQ